MVGVGVVNDATRGVENQGLVLAKGVSTREPTEWRTAEREDERREESC